MSTPPPTRKPAVPHRRTIMNVKSLPKAKREDLRRRAFGMFERGASAYAVGIELGVRNQTACAWKRRFDGQGPESYSECKRGPVSSKAAKLTTAQCRRLVNVVVDKTPDQLKFPFALWSSKAVQEYVLRKFGVRMCRRSVRRYMSRFGFRNRVPERYAREQRPEAVRKWLKRQYPAIRREARKKGAKVLWCDEAAILAGEIKTHGYAPRGTAPKLRAPANRGIRCNMISAVGNAGDMRFMIFRDAMNADKFKTFLEHLLKEFPEVAIFLICDNLRVHHAKCLRPWFAERRRQGRLFVHYLPSYSPELNPDEYLNRDTKAHMAERTIPTSTPDMEAAVGKHLKRRSADKEFVKRLFHKKEVRYAAEP